MLRLQKICLLAIVPLLAGCTLSGEAALAKPTDTLNGRKQLVARETFSKKMYTFKTVDGRQYQLEVFSPVGGRRKAKRSAIVWWSGGGWRWGGLGVYERQCAYLASRGMVAACAEYRQVEEGKPYSAAWAAEDAKSAMRWLRMNAKKLGVDPDRIVAAGESSGATMALQTALSAGFEAPGEDTSVSSQPNALVVFDPVTSVEILLPAFTEKMGMEPNESRRLIPMLNLDAGLPPTFFCYSDRDWLKPGLDAFAEETKRRGMLVTLELVCGQPHGFMKVTPWNELSVELVDRFLVSLKYLEGTPSIKPPQLPFDLGKPVFGKGLPFLPETAWFERPLKAYNKSEVKGLYQLSFAPLTDGRVAAIAVSESPRGFSRRDQERIDSELSTWTATAWNDPQAVKPAVICFIAFPYETQEIWEAGAPPRKIK